MDKSNPGMRIARLAGTVPFSVRSGKIARPGEGVRVQSVRFDPVEDDMRSVISVAVEATPTPRLPPETRRRQGWLTRVMQSVA